MIALLTSVLTPYNSNFPIHICIYYISSLFSFSPFPFSTCFPIQETPSSCHWTNCAIFTVYNIYRADFIRHCKRTGLSGIYFKDFYSISTVQSVLYNLSCFVLSLDLSSPLKSCIGKYTR